MRKMNIRNFSYAIFVIISLLLSFPQFNSPLTVVATPDPPTSGVWIISSGENITKEDQTILLNGSLIIENGGNLTLDNVTLRMNSSGVHYNITIHSGGSLTIKGKSTITAVNPNHQWYLAAFEGSSVFLENSTFKYGGYSEIQNGLYSGLWFNTSLVEVLNCSIIHNYNGLWFCQATNCTLANTTINDSYVAVRIGVSFSDGTKPGATNITIAQNLMTNIAHYGIAIMNSSKCNVRDNIIAKFPDDYDGIHVKNSELLNFTRNDIDNCRTGIRSINNSETIIIENSISNCTSAGIYTDFNKNSNIINNSISNCDYGIYLSENNNTYVIRNEITAIGLNEDATSGIVAFYSNHSKVLHNNLTNIYGRGIQFYYSISVNCSNNYVNDTRWGSLNIYYTNDSVFTHNTLLNSNESGGLYAGHASTNVNITNNVIEDMWGSGITLSTINAFVENNIIDSVNSFSGPAYGGISLDESNSTTIINNIIKNSQEHGIYSSKSSQCIIKENTIQDTNGTGIYLWELTHDCDVYGNFLISNVQHAEDNGLNNQWDNGTHGNWWDDYTAYDLDNNGVGDTPYNISGTANSQDRYPLMNITDFNSPTINSPADITYEYGSGGYITWTPTDENPGGLYYLYINGVIEREGIWDGSNIVFDLSSLTFSSITINFTLHVMDRVGNLESDTVFVTIVDTIGPTISQPSDLEIPEGAEGKSIRWTPYDLNPSHYQIFYNGTVIQEGNWTADQVIIFEINTTLPVGAYDFIITIFDKAGNSISDSVIVTIRSEDDGNGVSGFTWIPILLILGLFGGFLRRQN